MYRAQSVCLVHSSHGLEPNCSLFMFILYFLKLKIYPAYVSFLFACLLLTSKLFVQVLGLLIEVIKKGFLKHIDCILPVTYRILRSAVDAVTSRQVDFQSESIIPLWKEAYYSLVMLEKMVHQFQDLCFAKDLEVNLF